MARLVGRGVAQSDGDPGAESGAIREIVVLGRREEDVARQPHSDSEHERSIDNSDDDDKVSAGDISEADKSDTEEGEADDSRAGSERLIDDATGIKEQLARSTSAGSDERSAGSDSGDEAKGQRRDKGKEKDRGVEKVVGGVPSNDRAPVNEQGNEALGAINGIYNDVFRESAPSDVLLELAEQFGKLDHNQAKFREFLEEQRSLVMRASAGKSEGHRGASKTEPRGPGTGYRSGDAAPEGIGGTRPQQWGERVVAGIIMDAVSEHFPDDPPCEEAMPVLIRRLLELTLQEGSKEKAIEALIGEMKAGLASASSPQIHGRSESSRGGIREQSEQLPSSRGKKEKGGIKNEKRLSNSDQEVLGALDYEEQRAIAGIYKEVFGEQLQDEDLPQLARQFLNLKGDRGSFKSFLTMQRSLVVLPLIESSMLTIKSTGDLGNSGGERWNDPDSSPELRVRGVYVTVFGCQPDDGVMPALIEDFTEDCGSNVIRFRRALEALRRRDDPGQEEHQEEGAEGSSRDNSASQPGELNYSRLIQPEDILEKCNRLETRFPIPPFQARVTVSIPTEWLNKFKNDNQAQMEAFESVNVHTEALIAAWASLINAAERDAKEYPDSLDELANKLLNDMEKLTAKWEKKATEAVEAYFSKSLKALGARLKSRIKIVARLGISFGGLGASVVLLGTAATPAAPATLVPALIGIARTLSSIAWQLRTAMISVQQLIDSIEKSIARIQKNIARYGIFITGTFDAAKGIGSGLTGDLTNFVAPPIGTTLEDARRLSVLVAGMESDRRKLARQLDDLVGNLASGPDDDAGDIGKSFGPAFDACVKLWERIRDDTKLSSSYINTLTKLQDELKTGNAKMITDVMVAVCSLAQGHVNPPVGLIDQILGPVASMFTMVQTTAKLPDSSAKKGPDEEEKGT